MFLNAKVLALLGEMLYMVSPGYSKYSMIPISYCDVQCQSAPLCDNKSDWRCNPPEFSEWKYNELLANNKSNLTSEETKESLKNKSYFRLETYSEGLNRYAVIAQAANDVSKFLSAKSDKNYVSSCTKNYNYRSCQEIYKNKPWKWSPDELAYALITAAYFESGFRLDVHSGKGEFARGDCWWEDNKGKEVNKNHPDAHKVCSSVCLNQLKTDIVKSYIKSKNLDWNIEDLMGVDYDSTIKCFTVSTVFLSRARGWCNSSLSEKSNTDWASRMFAAYGTGKSCAPKIKRTNDAEKPQLAKWPQERAKVFYNAFKQQRKPSDEILKLINEVLNTPIVNFI